MKGNDRQDSKKTTHSLVGLILLGSGLVLLGLMAGLLVLGYHGDISTNLNRGSAQSVIPVKVHFAVPDLKLKDLHGQEVLLDDYRGKIILINNWATWCPPCKEEMPDLQAFYEKHKDEEFVIIGIEAGEPETEVSRFVETYGLTFPIWLDAENLSLSAFRNQALPSSYVVDREGMVRLAWTGPVSLKVLEEYVTPLIRSDG